MMNIIVTNYSKIIFLFVTVLLLSSLLISIEPSFALIDTWSAQTSGTGSWLNSVFFTDELNGWAVGNDGAIIYTIDGVNWKLQTSDTSDRLNSVFFTDANNGWAVGDDGTILHTIDGVNWKLQTSDISDRLNSVFFTDENNGWAVGRYGTILHTTDGGTTWDIQSSGITNWLFGVFFTDEKNGWAVGQGGTIIYTTDGGNTWDTPSSRPGKDLHSVFFVDENNGWAVGRGGGIIHTINGGENWSKQTSTTRTWLLGISFVDENNGWAVGRYGTILHTTDGGNTWDTPSSRPGKDLHSVFFVDENNGWAVGASGTVLKITQTIIDETIIDETIIDETIIDETIIDETIIDETIIDETIIDETILTKSIIDVDIDNGGSDNEHKTKPTFGLDHNTGRPLIEGGFTFNDKSFDITDNFWTPFAEQEVKIGQNNTFTIKTYADKQLHIQEFLFGIPAIGEAHNAELVVEIFFGYDGNIKDIKVIQETDIVDVETLKVTHLKSKCTSDDTIKKCNTTSLSMKFLEPLKDKVMALKAIDFKNRYTITYLNDGFDVTGESLNPMVSTMILGTEKYEGLLKVTQTDKYSNVWESDDGRTFEVNDSGTFKWTNETHERIKDTGSIKNRMHSEFAGYKDAVTQKAIIELLELCPTCLDSYTDFDDSWTSELPTPVDKIDDLVLQQKLIDENKRAQEIMSQIYSSYGN